MRAETPDELEAEALEAADHAQAARLRGEARALRGIEAAERLLEALELVEHAAGQVQPRALRAFAERLGRAYARSLHRLRHEEREAVRAIVREAAGKLRRT
jgi:hypothetical protein